MRTNIGEDYSVDPVLKEACSTVVQSGCANVQPGNRRLLQSSVSLVSVSSDMTGVIFCTNG